MLRLAREESSFAAVAHLFPGQPGAEGVNIIEFTGEDAAALRAQAAALTERLAASPERLAITRAEGADVGRVWTLRKAAAGLPGRAEGARRPLPFVEDCAVPPENLEPFIMEFRRLLDAAGLDYGMFGHVDAGVLHVRPALGLSDPAQEPLIREITEKVAALARMHGGLLWGEHGKGVRSEFVPEVFGPLYPALQRIKATFDPRGQLNPGKIAMPDGSALTRIDEPPLRGQSDRQVAPELRAAFAPAFGCNGNGACFNRTAEEVMCPSYKATGDRRMSPKGRAMLIREWLRQGGPDGRTDPRFEAEVKAAMDGCLSCRACASLCPVRVDVPAFRALFLDNWYRRHRRPLRDHALAWLELLLPLAARVRGLFNLGTRGPGTKIMARLGLTALPRMPRPLRGVRRLRQPDLTGLAPSRDVILIPDAFSRFFAPGLIADLDWICRRIGLRLWLAPYRPSGKPRQVLGRLAGFAAQKTRQEAPIRRLATAGLPLIGIEPAITLAYRQDYPADLPPVALVRDALAPALCRFLGDRPVPAGPQIRLLPHCSERALGAQGSAGWVRIFEGLGARLDNPPTGCCGMAGIWGHETANRLESEVIFDQSWRSAVLSAADLVAATGFSCRCQSRELTGRPVRHPLALMRELLAAQG